MANWSKLPELEQKVEALLPELAKRDIALELKKEIPYGTQVEGEGDDEPGMVTFYYSKKKGFSAVDNSKNETSALLCKLFLGEQADEVPSPKNGNNWSEIPELEQKVNGLLLEFDSHSISVTLKKEIPYGTQISCASADGEGLVTFYYSAKKGFSAVDNSKNTVSGQVCRIFNGESVVIVEEEEPAAYRWSPIPELEQKLTEFEPQAGQIGVLLTVKKVMQYGVQVTCEGPEESGTITFYYSKKKGFSVVENSKNGTVAEVSRLFTGKAEEERLPFRPRIGSDEAGKGDFFGPLVTAAFYIETEEMEQEILELGIRDSKKLNDVKIAQMARKIRAKWPEHCEIISPSVEKYNNLYGTIGNLNRLLGWMHGRILADLSERFFKGTPIEAIVDKFADESNVTKSVAGLERLDISAITHGEDAELAIAAASVLARDRFVFLMKKMNEKYEMDFPFGAGPQVKEAGRKFFGKYGRPKLKEVCKMHFKTAKEL